MTTPRLILAATLTLLALALLRVRRDARRWEEEGLDDIDWLRDFEQEPYLSIQMPVNPASIGRN